MIKVIIKKGDKYNKLTAIEFKYRNNQGAQFWLFKCQCGNEKVLCVGSVKREITKSCGCLRKGVNFKHGMCYTKTYKSWDAIKQRCLNINNKAYKYYGGRGITICNEWLGKNGFENFYNDMGDRHKNKTIDRIKNNEGYSKENCRWATSKEQQNNIRSNYILTFRNKTQTVSQWAEELEINRGTLFSRLYRGWSTERALTL